MKKDIVGVLRQVFLAVLLAAGVLLATVIALYIFFHRRVSTYGLIGRRLSHTPLSD